MMFPFSDKILLLTISILILGCTSNDQKADQSTDLLWYAQPAEEWEEALPLGNGRLGIMVFGKTQNERIQLNDDSLWPADLGWDDPDGTPDDLANIRQLLFDGKNAEADQLFVDKFSRKSVVRSHQTLGDLHIDFNHQNITEYKRTLNLGTAVASVSYLSDGDLISGEAFVSHPHQVIVLTFKSEAADGLNGSIALDRPTDEGFPTATTTAAADDLLIMRGEVTQRKGSFNSEPAPILEGVKFETRLKVKHEGGNIQQEGDKLIVKNAKEITLFPGLQLLLLL